MYLFRVKPGSEASFLRSWEELTVLIRSSEGSYGSRLHRSSEHDNAWFAYALWPDRDTYINSGAKLPAQADEVRERMRNACEAVETIFTGEVENDLIDIPPM